MLWQDYFCCDRETPASTVGSEPEWAEEQQIQIARRFRVGGSIS